MSYLIRLQESWELEGEGEAAWCFVTTWNQENREIVQANLPNPRAIILLYMFESLWEEKDL